MCFRKTVIKMNKNICKNFFFTDILIYSDNHIKDYWVVNATFNNISVISWW